MLGRQVTLRADVCCVLVAVTLPATIMTSSVPTTVGGHMMYPSPHAVMYAPTPGLADGGLAVLNAFPQAPSAMQVSHGQVQEQGKAALQPGAPWHPGLSRPTCVCAVCSLQRGFFAAVLGAPQKLGRGYAQCVFLGLASLLGKGLHELLMGKKEGEGFWDGQAAQGARRFWRGYVLT